MAALLGMSTTGKLTAATLGGALLRYRLMAFIVGVGLLILVFIGMPLQYGAGIPQVAAIVGPIHGALYIVYLAASFDLARRARFTVWQLAAMVGAGFIPFLAFVVEHRTNLRVQPLVAEEQAATAAGPAAG